MRTFFVILLLAWLIGIASGVYHLPFPFVIGVTALVSFFVRERPQIVIAAASLVFLGFLFGQHSRIAQADCRVASPLSGSIRELVRVEEKRITYLVITDKGCQIHVNGNRFPEYAIGDQVQIKGKIQGVERIKKDQAGYGVYLERQGIVATVSYPEVTMLNHHDFWLNRLHQRARQQVGHIFAEPEASFVMALLFGEQGTLPKEINDQFQHTGVNHILAISGQNISLLAAFLFVILWPLPLPPLGRTLLIGTFLWLYIFFIGAPTSAVRAAFFWSFFLLAFHLHRLVSLPTIVLLTAATMISWNPLVVQDIGFQLSLGAVIGIGLALFLIRTKAKESLWGMAKAALLVTLGATLMTGPIIAYSFGNISFISLFTNILIVPVASFVQVLAMLTLVISFGVPIVALLGSYVIHLAWQWMDIVTKASAALPGAYIENVKFPAWIIAIYYIVLFAASIFLMKKQRRSWREIWQ
jgi:competence protein ComEC